MLSRYKWLAENCPKITEICKKTVAASTLVRDTFEENGCDAFMGKASHSKKLDEIP